jgi:hypothetical protein
VVTIGKQSVRFDGRKIVFGVGPKGVSSVQEGAAR